MESTSDTLEQKQRVLAAYCARIAKLVLPVEGGLDPRDALVLIDCGVLSDESNDAAKEWGGKWPEVEDHTIGPLVFYTGEAVEPCVARARDLLLNARIEMRRGAISHLKAIASSYEVMSEYTSQMISQHSDAVLSEDGWRRAAIDLADALDDDWLLNLAGVRQAGPVTVEVCNKFIIDVLHPTNSTVQRCSPRILCPGLHQNEIESRRIQLIGAEHSIDRFCNDYSESFGHLPLGGEYALGKMLEYHKKPDGAEQVLQWAARVGTPVARYHACEAILAAEPRLTPAQRDLVSGWFWEVIVPSTSLGQPSEEHATWELMEFLARYYVHYLELRLPSDRSELISAMAWWMASRVVANWSEAGLSARYFVERLSQGSAATMSSIWDLVGPPMQPCMLRWLTTFGPSPWAISLLSAVVNESQMQWLMAGAGPGATVDRVAALTRITVLTANLPLERGSYRYAPDIRRSLCWALEVESDETKRTQLTMLAEGIDWGPYDTLSQTLEAMDERDPFMQSLLAQGVHQRLSNAALDGDTIWAVVSGTEWKSKTWLAIDAVVAHAIGRALVDDAARRRPEWAPQLPHLLAEVAETRSDSEEERLAMFGLVLRACSILNAPSGLIRLMRGRNGHHYRQFAATVKANLEQSLPQAGSWGAGRLRALLVDLL